MRRINQHGMVSLKRCKGRNEPPRFSRKLTAPFSYPRSAVSGSRLQKSGRTDTTRTGPPRGSRQCRARAENPQPFPVRVGMATNFCRLRIRRKRCMARSLRPKEGVVRAKGHEYSSAPICFVADTKPPNLHGYQAKQATASSTEIPSEKPSRPICSDDTDTTSRPGGLSRDSF